MQITTREIESVLIVDLTGHLDTAHSGEASDELARLTDKGQKKVVLNLDRLEFLSSAGLRVVLRAARALRAGGGEMKLCNAHGVVSEVLAAARFKVPQS